VEEIIAINRRQIINPKVSFLRFIDMNINSPVYLVVQTASTASSKGLLEK